MQHSIKHLTTEQFLTLSGKPYSYQSEMVVEIATNDKLEAVEMVKKVIPIGEVYGTYTSDQGRIILHVQKIWSPSIQIRNSLAQ